MDVDQIRKFINESIENQINWNKIRILGGEPTLHKQFFSILEILLEFKNVNSPNTRIQIVTNGYGNKVNEVLSKVPDGIEIENSWKNSESQPTFSAFNVAPVDLPEYEYSNYSRGCWIPFECGIGLTPYGYYVCAIAGGIDRIFGFDIGRKNISDLNDPMEDQLKTFCRLCGHFVEKEKPSKVERQSKNIKNFLTLKTNQNNNIHFQLDNEGNIEIMSNTWKDAYEKYRKEPPVLSRY